MDNIGIVMGGERMQKLGKKVGDVFKAYSISHRDGTGVRKHNSRPCIFGSP